MLMANKPTGSVQYQELREAIDYIHADAERIARALAVLDVMERDGLICDSEMGMHVYPAGRSGPCQCMQARGEG